MVQGEKNIFVAVVVAVAVLSGSARAWAQPTRLQSPVALPRVDVVAGIFGRRNTADADRDPTTWSGPGVVIAIDDNLNDHLAITTSVEKSPEAGASVLAGFLISTGFYYGNNRDPVPGRFFTRLLAGATDIGTEATRGALQMDIGADILLSRTRGLGLRWEVGYGVAPGAERHPAYARAAIGVIFGPRLTPRP